MVENKERFTYRKEKKTEISFPLGGIGSGCIGLSGNGRLFEWEIFNRPNKGGGNGFSHFAVKAESEGKVIDARVLNGPFEHTYKGIGGGSYKGVGFGVDPKTMSGIPHFKNAEFNGEFPIAELTFQDQKFPGIVKMTALNPFIPLNPDDSSIPGAFFNIEFENPTENLIDFTVSLTVHNPLPPYGVENNYSEQEGVKLLHMITNNLSKRHVKYGDLTVATDSEVVSVQENWYGGSWYDGITTFWKEFTQSGPLKQRKWKNPKRGKLKQKIRLIQQHSACHGSLAAHLAIPPKEKGSVRFLITWNFPNCYNYQTIPASGVVREAVKHVPKLLTSDKMEMPDADDYIVGTSRPKTWKNYYAVLFKDSTHSALYSFKHWDRLFKKTLEFKNILFSSTLPHEVIDAVSANISILKSPTVLRLEGGEFWGWEGCSEKAGCCPGSCTHVWNYAYALPFLFPSLERSMRDIDYKFDLKKDGHMNFRLYLPLTKTGLIERFSLGGGFACADGQFGNIIKTYRDWKISGDSEWLKNHWESVKIALEYAWSEKNKHGWDRDKDGVMEGRQHHTLDVESFGPNTYLTGFYLAALKASAEMAAYFGEDDKSKEFLDLFTRGKAWVDINLFNGEYYYHKIDLKDKSIVDKYNAGSYYWNEEMKEIKYQLGEACHIDQVVAQWHANLCGLGDIFDKQQTKTALQSLYKYNFKSDLHDHFNPCRVYGLEGESGIVMAQWPKDRTKPFIPSPYSQEMMNGFEYQAACHMIQEGFIEKGLELVRAIRNRYDGEKRNPWNEIECGSNYARSMASYSLLITFSGFEYNLVQKMIGFNPIFQDSQFKSFWSIGSGWGGFEVSSDKIILNISQGFLELKQFKIPFAQEKVKRISLGTDIVKYQIIGETVHFTNTITVNEHHPLIINI